MVAECLFLSRPDGVCFCESEGKEKVQTSICWLLTLSVLLQHTQGSSSRPNRVPPFSLLNDKRLHHVQQR